MRFFGDVEERVGSRREAAELSRAARALAALPPGAVRHGALAALLVRAAALAQGLADQEREGAGADVVGSWERAAMRATAGLGRALWRSWRAGGMAGPPAPDALDALACAALPEEVAVRRAEGFALYGVYPEAWAAAGTALAGSRPAVIGLRSIGTAAAAMVAAGAGGTRIVTARPVGHPFRRELRLAPSVAERLAHPRRPFAVADEGPGLSGSSFAAAASALSALGVPEERIHLFPSHAGEPGPAADEGGRALYARLARHVVPFEALFLGDAPLALGRLAEDAIGPADGPAEDLSAGAWRARLLGHGAPWPPSQGWRERRKYLVRAGGRS